MRGPWTQRGVIFAGLGAHSPFHESIPHPVPRIRGILFIIG